MSNQDRYFMSNITNVTNVLEIDVVNRFLEENESSSKSTVCPNQNIDCLSNDNHRKDDDELINELLDLKGDNHFASDDNNDDNNDDDNDNNDDRPVNEELFDLKDSSIIYKKSTTNNHRHRNNQIRAIKRKITNICRLKKSMISMMIQMLMRIQM